MIKRASVVVGGGLLGFGYYKYQTDLQVQRAFDLYRVCLPVVLHYRVVQMKHKFIDSSKSDKDKALEWQRLDDKYSGVVVDFLANVRGMYTKYGQMGAGFSNTLSETWREKLRELEDNVPPQPAHVVFQTIKEEIGKEPEEIFAWFENEPIGSASIGQVHKACLKETGEVVAVKVQYPDSQKLFRSDMKTIRSFLQIAAPEQVIILDELERSFEREFDYRMEAQNLELVRKNLGTKFAKEIKVPKPLQATQRMLVMEYLDGIKLIDGIREYGKVIAKQRGTTLEALESEMKKQIMEHGMPSRYSGPSATTLDLYVRMLKLRDKILNIGVGAWNWTTGNNVEYYHSVLPPNGPRIMDSIMRSCGHMLLVDGVFDADRHAGNFLLLKDSGLIGLIDLGAVKILTEGERLAACLLFASLHKKDKKFMLDMVRVSGYESKNFDEEVIWKLIRFGYDTFGEDLLEGKNIQEFMDDLYARDPWIKSPDNLVMAQLASIRLRSVGMSMNVPVQVSEFWGEIALKELERFGIPYEQWTPELMQKHFHKDLSVAQGSMFNTNFLS